MRTSSLFSPLQFAGLSMRNRIAMCPMGTGLPDDEGFVVFKGSTALKGTTESMTPGWTAFKNELIGDGRLAEKGALLHFTDDVLFNSPSAAAAVIYGNNANGRISWKTESGQTLKEIEEANSK